MKNLAKKFEWEMLSDAEHMDNETHGLQNEKITKEKTKTLGSEILFSAKANNE